MSVCSRRKDSGQRWRALSVISLYSTHEDTMGAKVPRWMQS